MLSMTGSLRCDFLGGSLDLYPINYIIKDSLTLNGALTMHARVELEEISGWAHIIESQDYGLTATLPIDGQHWSEQLHKAPGLKMPAYILSLFSWESPVHLSLSCQCSPGLGLGGSSAMGATVLKALASHKKVPLSVAQMVEATKNQESRVLGQGAPGYQDYYPALMGGVLSLSPGPFGVCVEQLFSQELARFLESHMSLIDSKESRHSGAYNWQVYQNFFSGDLPTRRALEELAALAQQGHQALRQKKYGDFLQIVAQEGRARAKLAKGIMTDNIKDFVQSLGTEGIIGHKVCGAGGGGAILILHEHGQHDRVAASAQDKGMGALDFHLAPPVAEGLA